jgi:hypothetical protein
MSNFKFTFVEDSRTKLVCIPHDGAPIHRYSFDGRRDSRGKLKMWDDSHERFTLENGIEYLKNEYLYNHSTSEWRTVFIADQGYPSSGKIHFQLDGNRWTPPEALIRDPKPKPAAQTVPSHFVYKLWVPLVGKPAVTFYSISGFDPETGEIDSGQALFSIIYQYQNWLEANRNPPVGKVGKIYGGGVYTPVSTNLPEKFHFDPPTGRAMYFGTKRPVSSTNLWQS